MPSAAGLFVILARSAPRAVVFRRRPSKQVALVLWHTDTDTFEVGQWLKGRIYERRCDLSPSGDKLIYFAANQKPPHRTWTAVSRPPWLTAMLFWPKGDAWAGGGLFESEDRIALNHFGYQMALGEGFALPDGVTVSPFVTATGPGEDDPIYDARRRRDGWAMRAEGVQHVRTEPKLSWRYDPQRTYAKPSPLHPSWELESRQLAVGERGEHWYLLEHVVADRRSGIEVSLGKSDWADWDANGDLLYAAEGKLYRLPSRNADAIDLTTARELIDLTPLKFAEKKAPPDALRWR